MGRSIDEKPAHCLSAVVVVVDSGDHDRIFEARDAIHGVLRSRKLHATHILVLANKQVTS